MTHCASWINESLLPRDSASTFYRVRVGCVQVGLFREKLLTLFKLGIVNQLDEVRVRTLRVDLVTDSESRMPLWNGRDTCD